MAEAGQRLALDETVPGASIGGTLATNASGPRRVATGTVRDLLIGVTVVRADGVVAKAGGRVVKNVAGYDLGKLMIGSFGTLAVVTEAMFRLHPLPVAHRWVTRRSPTRSRPSGVVQSVLHAQAVPGGDRDRLAADGHGRRDVLLEGREDGVAGRAATVRALLGERLDRVRRRRRRAGRRTLGPGRRGDDRATPQADLRALRARRRARRGDARPALHVRGSAGAGVVYAAIDPGHPGRRP